MVFVHYAYSKCLYHIQEHNPKTGYIETSICSRGKYQGNKKKELPFTRLNYEMNKCKLFMNKT